LNDTTLLSGLKWSTNPENSTMKKKERKCHSIKVKEETGSVNSPDSRKWPGKDINSMR